VDRALLPGHQQYADIVETYRMSGEVDYLNKVAVSNIAAYDQFYKQLIERIELSNVTSSFTVEDLKCTTVQPIKVAD
jgi:Lrp/AsnC family transcriptional regulator